jgi:hypothetical protein
MTNESDRSPNERVVDPQLREGLNALKRRPGYDWGSVNLVDLQRLAEEDPRAARTLIVKTTFGTGPLAWFRWLTMRRVSQEPISCDTCLRVYPLVGTDFSGWGKIGNDDICAECRARLLDFAGPSAKG